MTATGARSPAAPDPPAELVARFVESLARLWPERGRLGVAVSGGPDSLGLLLLAEAALPGQFETSEAVLSAMMSNDLYGRPTNYQETLAAKYRSYDAAALDAAIRGTIDPNGFVWVVVGDAAKVKPQLDKLGIPVEVVEAR